MAPRHVPAVDLDQLELICAFRHPASSTVVSLLDMTSGDRLPLLRWGDSIFAPVYEGMRFAVEVWNGSHQWIAIPTFVEGANLWLGGPLQPEECSVDVMWELRPRESMVLDALMDPRGQRGRPIVITRAGFGATVGEATFGTDAFRGQLRIFERAQIPPPPPPPAPERAQPDFSDEEVITGVSTRAGVVSAPSGPSIDCMVADPPAPLARPAMRSPAPAAMRPSALGAPRESRNAPVEPARARAQGPAGFGAAAEEKREHHITGMGYLPESLPIVALRTEFRDDLEEALGSRLRDLGGFAWPTRFGGNWRQAWTWPLAPHIPITPG